MSNLSEARIFRKLYKYELTALHIITELTSDKHSHFINISLRLLRSVNTLNPKLTFKTILINKSELLLNALYLEATLTFLRFAAKHCSIAQLFGGSYQYGAICCVLQTLQRENCLTEKENHTLCMKSDIKSINLRITKI